jgi:hypothetical protein
MEKVDDPQPSLAPAVRAPGVRLLVDLGRQRRKHIKRLKRGNGRLSRHVQTIVDQSRAELGIDHAIEIVPVVLLYRRSDPEYVLLTRNP